MLCTNNFIDNSFTVEYVAIVFFMFPEWNTTAKFLFYKHRFQGKHFHMGLFFLLNSCFADPSGVYMH
jgi:hypothetical protein